MKADQSTTTRPGASRRDIVRLTAMAAGIFAIPTTLWAQSTQGPRGSRGQFGERDQNSENGRRPQGPPDPSRLAAMLIAEFDDDGDGALSATELATALQALHERRPHGPPAEGSGGDDERAGRPRRPQ